MKITEKILLSLATIAILIDVFTNANYGGIIITICLCTLSFFYSAAGILIFQEGKKSFINTFLVRMKFTTIGAFVLDALTRLSLGTAPIAVLAVLQKYSWHSQAADIIIVSSGILILFLFLNKTPAANLKRPILIRSAIAAIIGILLKFVPIN